MTMQVCFVNTDDLPVEVQHVCFYTRKDGDKITLIEVIREKYPHPEAKEDAFVWFTTERNLFCCKTNAERAANLLLLENAQSAVSQLKRLLKT